MTSGYDLIMNCITYTMDQALSDYNVRMMAQAGHVLRVDDRMIKKKLDAMSEGKLEDKSQDVSEDAKIFKIGGAQNKLDPSSQ